MYSPASFQTAVSTHWPSWSQAPFWCGSPKSPSEIGPSTAETISDRRISVGGAGEHVAAADAALGAHQPGALQGEQDLLEVGLGEAGALGDVADRCRARLVGVQGERQQRPAGIVTSGRHSHGSMLRAGPPVPVDIGATAGTRRSDARLGSVPTVSAGELVATEAADAPVLPDYAGANVRGIVPALLGPATGRAAGAGSPNRRASPPGGAARARRPRLGPVADPPEPAPGAVVAGRRPPSPRWRRPPRPPRSARSPPG